MATALMLYAAGVGFGLWRTDASPALRIALALLWPIGPLAFLVTITILLAAAAIAFPLVGGAVAALSLLTWWWLA